jgi:hypothetical protein
MYIMQLGQKPTGHSVQLGIKSAKTQFKLGQKSYRPEEKFNNDSKGPDLHNGIINNFNSVDAYRQPNTRPIPSQSPAPRNPGIERSHRSKTPSSIKWG